MNWKSASAENIKQIKIRRGLLYIGSILLFLISAVIIVIINPELLNDGFYLPLRIIYIISSVGIIWAFYVMKFRFREITDEYIALYIPSITASPHIFRFYFDEIDSLRVSYMSYTVRFVFAMKYGETSINIWNTWGFGNIYKWLFPVLDKLNERCKLTVDKNPKSSMIKEWIPPGQSSLDIALLGSEKATNIVLLSILFIVSILGILAILFLGYKIAFSVK